MWARWAIPGSICALALTHTCGTPIGYQGHSIQVASVEIDHAMLSAGGLAGPGLVARRATVELNIPGALRSMSLIGRKLGLPRRRPTREG